MEKRRFIVIIPTIRTPAQTEPILNRLRLSLTHETDVVVLNGAEGKAATMNYALDHYRDSARQDYWVTMDDDILVPDGWQDDVIMAHEVARFGIVGLDLADSAAGRTYMMEVNEPITFIDPQLGSIQVRPVHTQNVGGIFMSMSPALAGVIGKYPWDGKTVYELDEDHYRCLIARRIGQQCGYVVCGKGAPAMVVHADTPEYQARKAADIKYIRNVRGVAH